MWILRSRRNDQNRFVIDCCTHRIDIGSPVVANRNTTAFDIKVICAFFESCVCRRGNHHVHLGEIASLAFSSLSCGAHSEHEALCATRCHEACGVVVSVRPASHHIDHLLLHDPKGGECSGVQGVLARESSVGLFSERQGFVASNIGECEAATFAPAHIVCAKRFDAVENCCDGLTWTKFTKCHMCTLGAFTDQRWGASPVLACISLHMHKLHNGHYERNCDGSKEDSATGSAASISQLMISIKLSFVWRPDAKSARASRMAQCRMYS